MNHVEIEKKQLGDEEMCFNLPAIEMEDESYSRRGLEVMNTCLLSSRFK